MSYEIEKLTDMKTIKIILKGTLDQDSRKNLHLKATSFLTITRYHRLLIDVRNSVLAKDYSPLDSIEMANYMKKFVFHKNTKIAFLSADTTDERKDFVNIARLNGINIKYFTELSEAITWLR